MGIAASVPLSLPTTEAKEGAGADRAVVAESSSKGEEEGERCFCRFMKRGGCKEEFEAWEACVDEADAAGTYYSSEQPCRRVTAALKKCMDAHADHYEPVLCADPPPAKEGAQGVAAAKESGKAGGYWEHNLWIKGRWCKQEFVAWDKCVQEAGTEDSVERCRGVTAAIKKCMDVEADYYESALRALNALAAELDAAWARREASGSESSSPEPPLVPVPDSNNETGDPVVA